MKKDSETIPALLKTARIVTWIWQSNLNGRVIKFEESKTQIKTTITTKISIFPHNFENIFFKNPSMREIYVN